MPPKAAGKGKGKGKGKVSNNFKEKPYEFYDKNYLTTFTLDCCLYMQLPDAELRLAKIIEHIDMMRFHVVFLMNVDHDFPPKFKQKLAGSYYFICQNEAQGKTSGVPFKGLGQSRYMVLYRKDMAKLVECHYIPFKSSRRATGLLTMKFDLRCFGQQGSGLGKTCNIICAKLDYDTQAIAPNGSISINDHSQARTQQVTLLRKACKKLQQDTPCIFMGELGVAGDTPEFHDILNAAFFKFPALDLYRCTWGDDTHLHHGDTINVNTNKQYVESFYPPNDRPANGRYTYTLILHGKFKLAARCCNTFEDKTFGPNYPSWAYLSSEWGRVRFTQ